MVKMLAALFIATAGIAMAAIRVPEPAVGAEIGTAAIGLGLLVWRIIRKNR